MAFRNGPWLGQVPLILGPSSWGAGMVPPFTGEQIPAAFKVAQYQFVRHFMGRWGIVGVGDGYRDGRLVLEVLTKEDPEATAAMLPGEFMGFRVVVSYSGEIRLQ